VKLNKIFAIFILTSVFTGCGDSIEDVENNIETNKDTISVVEADPDVLAISELVRSMYEWQFSNEQTADFPVEDLGEEIYTKIDDGLYELRVSELENSGYFSQIFIDNYIVLSNSISDKLESGELVYNVGELPPYGTGANPWCECQDYEDEFWSTMIINVVPSGGEEDLKLVKWSFEPEGEGYGMTITKENDDWKIESMKGFTQDTFF